MSSEKSVRITIDIPLKRPTVEDLINELDEPRYGVRIWKVDGGYIHDRVIDECFTTNHLRRYIDQKLIWVEDGPREMELTSCAGTSAPLSDCNTVTVSS